MIRRAVDVSLTRRSLFLALAVGVLIFAFTQLDKARVETLPEFTPPFVEVQTEALGLSAYEVEQLVTVPLEADLLNGVAFVEEIRSESIPSLSSIVMTFEPGTDILDARQLVQERLTQAHGLPNVSRAPAMVQPLSSESRVMMIGLTSDELNPVELGVLARWTIRPKLMGVDGVANVAVWGHREQQLQVQVVPELLEEHDVALQDVVNTAGNALWVTPLTFLEASTPGVGGFIDGPNQRIAIQHVPAISEPVDMASVVIEGRTDVTLGDVAVLVEDHQPLIGDAIVGDDNGLYLIVEKFPWSNTIETTEAVEAAIEELAPGLTQVTLDTDLFRPAGYLERAMDNVGASVIAGVIFVGIVAMFLLRSWREGLTAVISMVLAVLVAASVLYILGATVSAMLLAGVGVATVMIIDDAIRNVHEHAQVGRDDGRGLGRRLAANSDSFVYSAVVLLILLVPAFFMDGAAGEFVPDITWAMVVALASAFAVALFVTPAIGSLLLSPEPAAQQDVGAEGGYVDLVRRTAGYGPPILGGFVVLLLIGGLLVLAVDRQFVPQFRQTDLVVEVNTAAGVSLPETIRLSSSLADEISAVEGVEQAGTHVGRAILSDEVTNVNSSEVWLRIDPDADYDNTVDAVQEVIDSYPGIGQPLLNTYSNERVDAELRQETHDLVARLYGEQPGILTQTAVELQSLVAGVDGVENVRAQLPILEPTIEIDVDLERAAELHVRPGDVRRAAATLLSGIEVGSLFEDQKVFEVVVWSTPDVRSSVTSVEELRIDTPDGPIPLSDVADVTIRPNERIIERDAVSRYIDIVADVPGGDVSAAEDRIQELIAERGLPFEFHVGFVSDRAELDANWRQTVLIGIAAAITIFLLLQAAFSSFRLSALMMLAMPAAVTGSIAAVVIWGGEYSIGSMAGMVAIAGLTLRSGMALLKRYELLQLGARMELGPELVVRGAREMLRPTVASLVAAAALAVAFIVPGSRAGLEVLSPMGVAVLGGVVTSGLVTLILLPAAYQAIARPAVAPELFRGDPVIDLDAEADSTELIST